MRFPSFEQIFKRAGKTFIRFPLAIVSAVLASLVTIYVVNDVPQTEDNLLINFILTAVLGIPLFTAISLMVEEKEWKSFLKPLPYLIGTILLVTYYFILPNDLDQAPRTVAYRYILYFLGVHLLVAMGPYWFSNKMGSFWQYNKTLFLRFLTAVLYSAVLFAGLAAALGAIDLLLGFDFDEVRYLQLFFIIAGIFNTWFFLSGIPESLAAFNKKMDYPKGLKVFTQTVLIPLVVVYLVILYLYIIKIIVQWQWPEGSVSILVLSFSVAGILANLLLYPIRNKPDHQWIKHFSKNYYRALVPLTILLLLAIGIRINEYGFTVERYFVLILGLWLAGIILYFIISKKRNIKVIPGSLCMLAFLISFGPWSAFSVSKKSQLNRMQTLLQKNEVAEKSFGVNDVDSISRDYRYDITSTLNYLEGTHGIDKKDAAKILGVAEISIWEKPSTEYENFGFSAGLRGSISIKQYDWLVNGIRIDKDDALESYKVSSMMVNVQIDSMSFHVSIDMNDNNGNAITISTDSLKALLFEEYGKQSWNIPPEIMVLQASNTRLSAKLFLRHIEWAEKDDKTILSDAQFDMLLKFKQ